MSTPTTPPELSEGSESTESSEGLEIHEKSTNRRPLAIVVVGTIIVAALILIGFVVGQSFDGKPEAPGPSGPDADPVPSQSATQAEAAPAPPTAVETHVVRVIDGDTIAVEPVDEDLKPSANNPEGHIVNLLGIDAPELNPDKGNASQPECGAVAAKEALENSVFPGDKIIVTVDENSERTDSEDSQAYVTDAGLADVGERQVAGGYALPLSRNSSSGLDKADDYVRAGELAVSQKLGSYGSCGGDFGRS